MESDNTQWDIDRHEKYLLATYGKDTKDPGLVLAFKNIQRWKRLKAKLRKKMSRN